MEVTKYNFYDLIPEIKEAIEKCTFISIDCELTGLNTANNINAFDTQKQYYEKIKKNSKNFLIIQYGLCLFRYDNNTKTFKQQGYNFYVFPKSGNRHVPDHRFLCQSSSIDFLITCGFDFNKLFKEGIPYLNANEEDKYKETLSDVQKARANQIQNDFSPDTKNNVISMTTDEKNCVKNILEEIEDFIVSDDEERILTKCNVNIRRLVYQEAQKVLINRATLQTRLLDNKDRVLVVSKLKSKSVREEENRKVVEQEVEEFQKCIGFSTIIKMIVESNKLVVGHNMFLDLLHTIDQFLTPLPYSYEEFKELAGFSFSKILDTKYMSGVTPFKSWIDSNVLANLLTSLQKEPFVLPNMEIEENKEGYSLKSNKEHEAGYDAYITGVCFLTMWNYLHKKLSNSDFPDFSLLEPYINRLFLMKLHDAPYINLGGADPVTSKDHVVYICFPKHWKLNDIVQLFSPFGNIYVSWINDHSAFVSLQKKDQLSVVLSTLSQSDTYTIMTYTQYQTQITEPNSIAPPPLAAHSSSSKKQFADNNHASIRKRKNSFVDNVSKKKLSNEFNKEPLSMNEVDNSMTKLTVRQILTKKKIKQTFAEVSWD